MNKVKKFFRHLFRYKLISIFFIVCQIVVYSSVFGALSIYNKAYDKEMDKLAGISKNRISMDATTISYRDIFTYAGMDMEQGNLLIAGRLSLPFLEAGCNNRSELIIKTNEELPYPLLSGRLPGSEAGDAGKRLIALGRGKLKYVWERDGKQYVTIASEEYEVVGVIGSTRSDYWDYKLVFHVDCLGENTRNTIIKKGSYTFELSSNYDSLDNAYTEVYNNIKSVDSNAVIDSKKKNSTGDNYISQALAKDNMKVNVLVYIFCIFNCMLMSEFWIIQKRKEIAIRKVCGMSDGHILLGIAENMLSLSAVALIIFVAASLLINIVSGGQQIIMFRFTTLAGVLAAMLIVVALTMGYPIYKIMRMDPVQILGNGD